MYTQKIKKERSEIDKSQIIASHYCSKRKRRSKFRPIFLQRLEIEDESERRKGDINFALPSEVDSNVIAPLQRHPDISQGRIDQSMRF